MTRNSSVHARKFMSKTDALAKWKKPIRLFLRVCAVAVLALGLYLLYPPWFS